MSVLSLQKIIYFYSGIGDQNLFGDKLFLRIHVQGQRKGRDEFPKSFARKTKE